jgi:AcrR family transcriptional regulator
MANLRARHAAQTRAEILRAARGLFAERGYAATSVKDLAAAAGVSVQTVYDSVGSKADVVRQLNDHLDAEAGIGALAQAIPTEADPQRLIAIPARISCALVAKCGDILHATASGSASEPALARVAAVGFQRHVDGVTGLAGRHAALGALRPGLSVEAAASSIAVLTDVWFVLRLVDEYGWQIDECERWMVDTLTRVVLQPARLRASPGDLSFP